MTTPAQYTILREQVVPSAPGPGRTRNLVVITYQLAARPPQLVVIPATELPDQVWLAGHPGVTQVPPFEQQQGLEARRRFIQAQINRAPRPARG